MLPDFRHQMSRRSLLNKVHLARRLGNPIRDFFGDRLSQATFRTGNKLVTVAESELAALHYDQSTKRTLSGLQILQSGYQICSAWGRI